MNSSARNPNHPAVRGAEDQWHKIAALLMAHFGKREIVITLAEIDRLAADPAGTNIAIQFDDARGVVLRLVDNETAQRLAEEEGGLLA